MHSKVTENILLLISNCIICNLVKNIDCEDSAVLMVEPTATTDHQ